MDLIVILLLYVVPFIGCMFIIRNVWKSNEEDQGVLIMIVFIISLIPLINLFVSFIIIGSHYIDKSREYK